MAKDTKVYSTTVELTEDELLELLEIEKERCFCTKEASVLTKISLCFTSEDLK